MISRPQSLSLLVLCQIGLQCEPGTWFHQEVYYSWPSHTSFWEPEYSGLPVGFNCTLIWFMTSIIVCGVPISGCYKISIGAPLSAGRRGPDWIDFASTIWCCRFDPSPCWAYGSRDDLPTTPPNIAGSFLVHREFSYQMSEMYVASFTTACWLEASTFRKTIACRWSCWISVSACCCTSIGAKILSPMFQTSSSLLGATEFAGNFAGSWSCCWKTSVLCYHADHIDPQHSFLGQSNLYCRSMYHL